ncbi:UNVERIFIED_ORG: 2,4-dienoyl-CoA reductase-like NADH-dependent reductase (Old Yellow Enzyme family) [Atlantibacter sp. SORGH_AS 304]|nr:2,4-dienoyl-CoA reductase-like NADH-dependent reductase (Old Yellow Enzyme family) [Atlantibacter sp. SORGH_AS_0304]
MRFPLSVIESVRKTIAEHATDPFLMGYRISLDEHYEDGLRIDESLQLVDRLVDEGIDYLHVSLGNALEAKPVDAPNGSKVIEIVRDHLAGRIPLIVAGQLRTPEQAEDAVKAGVSLTAVGQGMVMNPDWVKFVDGKAEGKIALSIAASDVEQLAIPQKLWRVIEETTGWFNIR